MQETKQGDTRIYIVSTLFFVCIVAGGAFLCLYMFQPEVESASWYPVIGIILVGIPWIFWIATYTYRCFAHCLCVSNGGNVNREHSSLTKKPSCALEGHVCRSMHSSENEGSPDGDHHHVRFQDVVMLGKSEYNQDELGGESPTEDAQQFSETEHEGKEKSQDGIAFKEDHISAASWNGEEPLIVLDST